MTRIRRRKISLATLLSGLVSLSVALTLTILLFAAYKSNKKALYNTTLLLNASTAQKMSLSMESLFQSMRMSLQSSAALLPRNSTISGESDIQRYLDLLRSNNNYFNSIVSVDEKGLIRAISPSSIATAGQQTTSEAAKQALKLRTPAISKPYTGTSGRLLVLISEPMYGDDGAYRGFIGGTIYLQEDNILTMMFGKSSIDETGAYYYVTDSGGRLIFHPYVNRIGEDEGVTNLVIQKLMQGVSGSEVVVNSRGKTFLAGYSYISDSGWGIVVQSPIEHVNKQLNKMIWGMVLYTMLPFVLLMAAALYLARRLARPFIFLADLVSKWKGEDSMPLPVLKNHWNREADLLTKAISSAFIDMKKQTDELTIAAMTDPLTGLTNRRTLESVMGRWVLDQLNFSLIVMDIDHFKSVNDTYGHQAGDEILKYLAHTVKGIVRPHDQVCRYGGEEFVVLLAHLTLSDAFQIAERIRTCFAKGDNPLDIQVTISMGIAHYPLHADSADELFQRADEALYNAKKSGRNRTIIAED